MHVFTDTLVAHIELDAAGQILDGGKAGLAHDALEHDATGHADFDRRAFELLSALFTVEFIELARGVFAGEIVGIGLAALTPGAQLFAAFGDQVVFILGGG